MHLSWQRGLAELRERRPWLVPPTGLAPRSPGGPRQARRRKRRARRLLLEPLEDRTLLAVSISGNVFHDANSNGVRDGTEPGLAGVTVFLDQDHNGVFNSRDVTFTPATFNIGSDLAGFGVSGSDPLDVEGLPAQVAHVKVAVDVAYNGSGPALVGLLSPTGIQVQNAPDLIILQPGDHFHGTFSDDAPPGTVRPIDALSDPGSHVYDGNPNGQWQLFFAGLAGTVDHLTLNSWSLTFTVPETSTQTDTAGNYTFNDLAPGNYAVAVALTAGATQTLPAGGAQRLVTVAAGQSNNGVDFGVHAAPDLAGLSFQVVTPTPDWGKDVTVKYTLTNNGAGDAGPFDVELRLSNDGTIDPTDPLLKTLHFDGLAGFATASGQTTVTLPGAPGHPPSGFQRLDSAFLGFLIDPANAVAESSKANNSNQGSGIDLAVIAPSANQALTSGPGTHQQPSVAVDPLNANHVVVAYMDYTLQTDGYAGLGVAVSQDGGGTWQHSAVPLPADFAGAAGYPVVRFDGQRHVYVSFMAATFLGPKPPLIYPRGTDASGAQFTSFAFQSNNGIFVARSDDDGLNWNPADAVVSHLYTGQPVFGEAIPDLAIDTSAKLPDGSPNPNYGNLYVTWTRAYPSGQFPGDRHATGGSDVLLAVRRPGDKAWLNNRMTVLEDPGNNGGTDPGNGFDNFSHVTVGPQGDVYVSLFASGAFDVFHSFDAGVTFSTPDNTFGQQTGIPFVLAAGFPNQAFAVTPFDNKFRALPVRGLAADPTRPGTVYAVEAILVGNPSNARDSGQINFAVSRDYGQSWEQVFTVGGNAPDFSTVPLGLRQFYSSVLNDDDGGRFLAFTNASQLKNEVISGQVLPKLSVDAQGNVSVIWYDTRRDPANHNLDVFGVTSTDGGKHFSANYRVTDASFDANAGQFTDALGQTDYFLGDALGLATAAGNGYAAWTDTRLGEQDIFFARYPILPVPPGLDDHFDPNNSPATATDLGKVSVQRLLPRLTVTPDKDDWFRLQAAATGNLVVAAQGSATSHPGVLELWDGSGTTRLATGTDLRDDSGHVIEQEIVLPTLSGQTYLVRVAAGAGAPLAGVGYALVVRSLTADLGTQVHGTEQGSLAKGGQALYRLTAAVAGSLQVTATPGTTFQGKLALQILNADGLTVLATGTKGSGSAVQASLSVDAGQVVLLQVSGGQNDFALEFTNFDQFENPQPAALFFPTNDTPTAVAAVDVNHDHKPDLVTASASGTDPVSVLLGNGDGTFQAARGFDAGPGSGGGARGLTVADLNNDGTPDVAVTNFTSSDVAVLLGNGDGTLQPGRRFNAPLQPEALTTGHFHDPNVIDLAVLQRFSNTGAHLIVDVLVGRGDGTFRPPQALTTTFTSGGGTVLAGDFNGDGKDDLAVFSFNDPAIDLFLGNGDGTFQPVRVVRTAENVATAQLADLNGDGHLDIITTGTVDPVISVLLGNGDGTFQPPQTITINADRAAQESAINGLVVVDFGGPGGPGKPDGHLDLVAEVFPRIGNNSPEIFFLPGLADAGGHFAGFGAPQRLASGPFTGPLTVADFTGDGSLDIAAAVTGGVEVIYSTPPALAPNTTVAAARDLGTVVHTVSPTQAIVPGHEDAYYTLTVPTEAVKAAGDEVFDFSGLFTHTGGGGLSMEVRDKAGRVLGSGAHFRVVAAQGIALTLHVFGVPGADGTPGVGTYTLDIDTLPQVVGVQAVPALPGGPTTSLVITFQGDRLDPDAAENTANYRVVYLGTTGATGPFTGQLIPIGTSVGEPVVYDPGANLAVASGLTYPTAVRQTVTLMFAKPLPVGSYELDLLPAIQAASFNAAELGLLAGQEADHPLVSRLGGQVNEGSRRMLTDLVMAATGTDRLGDFNNGTPFLTGLHDDMGRILDDTLTEKGDGPAVTRALLDEIVGRLVPGLGVPGSRPTTVLVIVLDPVSIDLADPQGKRATYDLQTNQVANERPKTFVEVGGNVEVLVLADVAGTYQLNVADVPGAARGGAVLLGAVSDQAVALTDALRAGVTSFQFDLAGLGNGQIAPLGGGTPSQGAPGELRPGSPPVVVAAAPPGSTSDPGTAATAGTATLLSLLVGLTTAPVVVTDGGRGVGEGGTLTALLAASSLLSAHATLGSAESGGGGGTGTFEQVVRDLANGVGERFGTLVGEVGSSARMVAETGQELLAAPLQALRPALEGLEQVGQSLGEIGGEVIQALLPSLKPLAGPVRGQPNGKKNTAPPPQAVVTPREEDMEEEPNLPPSEAAGPQAVRPADPPEGLGACLAAALFVTGVSFSGRKDHRKRAGEQTAGPVV